MVSRLANQPDVRGRKKIILPELSEPPMRGGELQRVPPWAVGTTKSQTDPKVRQRMARAFEPSRSTNRVVSAIHPRSAKVRAGRHSAAAVSRYHGQPQAIDNCQCGRKLCISIDENGKKDARDDPLCTSQENRLT